MQFVVVPSIDIGTSCDKALDVLRAARRSALIATDKKKGAVWLIDLPDLLDGIREGKTKLSQLQSRQRVLVPSPEYVDPLPKRTNQVTAWMYKSLERFSSLYMLLPTVDPQLKELGRALPKDLFIPFKAGRADPKGLRVPIVVLTEGGLRAVDMQMPAVKGVPQFSMVLLATRFEPLAEPIAVPPAWCTCSKKATHKYPHRGHINGEPCPSGDNGTLNCS